ncbi:MAG TPA: secondary thiamine-phosphate synthase enzyme YjbQ [Planctomycetota bacterium]|nr:secondary thiamine-phosphate synthase enzyme YjbQ [Planctomycetota bacterium]
MIVQRLIRLRARPRGVHLVTDEITAALPELARMRAGLASVFLRHTSAALAINENADPTVRQDATAWLDRVAPEGLHYAHDDEGDDDMPAHLKALMVGPSLTIPISDGRLAFGTWQGVWLIEARDQGGVREVLATLMGD